MEQQIKELKMLVESSERILITSHISPDPDALSSVLLLGTTLKHNYPAKEVVMALEEEPEGLDFLAGYSDVKFEPLVETIKVTKPDLFVMLDAVNYERCSRTDGEQVRQYLAANNVKTAIIDHHQPAGKDSSDVYVYQGSPATVQDVYEIFFNQLRLKKPENYAQTAMLGLYADTGGFAYENPRHTDTLLLADELINAGANIEKIKNLLNQFSEDDMRVFGELVSNISHHQDYTYSFIRNEFVENWLEKGKSGAQLNKGTESFINQFIRNIEGRKWGFIVYRNVLQGDNIYSSSFRAVSGAKDVALIANKLGGGGHKPAAGAKIEAKSVEEAIQKVQRAIDL